MIIEIGQSKEKSGRCTQRFDVYRKDPGSRQARGAGAGVREVTGAGVSRGEAEAGGNDSGPERRGSGTAGYHCCAEKRPRDQQNQPGRIRFARASRSKALRAGEGLRRCDCTIGLLPKPANFVAALCVNHDRLADLRLLPVPGALDRLVRTIRN